MPGRVGYIPAKPRFNKETEEVECRILIQDLKLRRIKKLYKCVIGKITTLRRVGERKSLGGMVSFDSSSFAAIMRPVSPFSLAAVLSAPASTNSLISGQSFLVTAINRAVMPEVLASKSCTNRLETEGVCSSVFSLCNNNFATCKKRTKVECELSLKLTEFSFKKKKLFCCCILSNSDGRTRSEAQFGLYPESTPERNLDPYSQEWLQSPCLKKNVKKIN